jgi:uncharacterized protein (TIGR04255 family)
MPVPDGGPLTSAPVQLAVFQLDFEEERPLKSRDGIAWQKGLAAKGYHLPRLASVKQRTLNVAMAALGVPIQQEVLAERNGWQVFMEDGVSNFALYSTGINFERVHYPGYVQFRKEALDAYTAASEILEPKVANRVFLSYANALSSAEATSAGFWRGKVKPHFLGPPSDDHLTEDFSRSLSAFTFENGEYNADVRIGVQPDRVYPGCTAFVFQTEVARKAVHPMEVDELGRSMDSLHETALKIFHAILDEGFITQLREGGKFVNA